MKFEPRTVYVVSFDTTNTDLKYFVSHPDIVLDGVADADIFYGDIIDASAFSQGLNPIRANATIGGISFTFVDTNRQLSALLNSKLLAGDGLRAKRVQHWIGEKGADWTSGYTLIQTHQINDSIKVVQNGNAYQFTARDIQRSQLKNIFIPKETTTTAAISKTAITIGVGTTSGLQLLQHGPSYSDAPNALVVYIRIKDEVIRCTAMTSNSFTVDSASSTLNGNVAKGATSIVVTDASLFDSNGVGFVDDGAGGITEIKWTAKTSNTLNNVTGVTTALTSGWAITASNGRGALGTIPAAYDFDVGAADRVKVIEHIYYELPAMKLAYAILTGTLYGSADTIPAHHTLAIDGAWISTSEFIQYSDDLWDPADDTKGIILYFNGLGKTNAKKFIEEELYFWCGVFSPILNTGELGLKRMTGVLSDAAYSRIWNETNIISVTNARFDLNDIYNDVSIDWNYDPISKSYTRPFTISDSNSYGRWGLTKTLELKSKGLHGSIHTDAILAGMFDTWRDRHVGPPFKATVTLDYTQRDVRVGDIVRLQLSNMPEFTDEDGNYSSFDSSVEVQRIRFNPKSGTVTCDVFGSTYKAQALLTGHDDPSPLAASWFTSAGTDLSTVSTLTSSVTGSTLTITSGSLTGADDLSSSTATTNNEAGIFYWVGDVIVNGQVDIDKNVEWRIDGFATFNASAKINGKGRGLAGGTSGIAGALGNTRAGGGFFVPDTALYYAGDSTKSDDVTGIYSKVPTYQIINNGGTSLTNTPRNLMGSSGGKGGDVTGIGSVRATGGNGGNGGAGFVLYCKGASGTAGTSVDLSGNDGSAGGTTSNAGVVSVAGTGAGGAGGGFALFLIGNTITSETLSPYFVSNHGATAIIGTPLSSSTGSSSGSAKFLFGTGGAVQSPVYSYYTGIGARDDSSSNQYLAWVPDNITATPDPSAIADTPLNITFTENSNVPQTPGENLATIDVLVSPPSDTSYSHSMIEYKLATDTDIKFQRIAIPAKDETTVTLAMDGLEYTFRAYPVNVDGVESNEFIEKNFTVSNAQGGVVLGAGNYVKTSPTVSEPVNGEGIIVKQDGVYAYSTDGTLQTVIYAADGSIVIGAGSSGIDNMSDAAKLYTNLIDPTSWAVGSSGSQGDFILNGSASENNIVLAAGPFNYSQPLWECGNDTASDADGGWNNSSIAQFDDVKSYRLTVFVKRNQADGATYFGCHSSYTNNLDGTANSNPYFWYGDLPQWNKWYMLVGVIHGSGWGTTDTGVAGVYDPDTGERVIAGTEYKNIVGATAQMHRAYLYYATDVTTKQWFANPRVDEIDGNEIPLAMLMGAADVTSQSLQNGTTISGGGIILNGGGSLKSTGKTVGTGTGVFLGWDTSAYKLDVGDHTNEKYIYFDGTDLNLGHNVKVRGGDTFGNKGVYKSFLLGEAMVDSLWDATYGGYITRGSYFGDMNIGHSLSSSTSTVIYSYAPQDRSSPDASKNSGFEVNTRTIQTNTGDTLYISMGRVSTVTLGYGFKISGNTIRGITCTAASCTTTTASVTSGSMFRAEMISGTSVSFYVEDVLLETVTTDVPSSGTMAGWFRADYTAAGGGFDNEATLTKVSYYQEE